MNIIDYITRKRIDKVEEEFKNKIKEIKYNNPVVKKYLELEENFNNAMEELFNSQDIEAPVLKINKYEPHMKYVIAREVNNKEIEELRERAKKTIEKFTENSEIATMMLTYAETKEEVEDVLITYGYLDKKTKQPIF